MSRIETWGIAGSVVDGGRLGLAWLGQSRGGAVDLRSLALVNRLLGNDEAATAFETSGGLTLSFDEPTMVALAGAAADATVTDGPPVGWGAPVVVPAGARLRVIRLQDGARAYVGVRGGVVADGRSWHAGSDPGTPAATQAASRAALADIVHLWPGPRLDRFAPGAWQLLTTSPFDVVDTSRVGVRLDGPPLTRSDDRELPSEGMVEGAVQVPPDGHPIVMLADHPTTGGYPVIAVVDPDDLWLVGQAAVGTTLMFVPAAGGASRR